MYLLFLKQILNIVNREDDLNGNNIVGKIGKQIEKKCPSTYKEWEERNFDINYKFSNNNYYGKGELTLLRVAFLDNQENVVKALLAVDGINVNFQDLFKKTLLHLAIEKGDENIVKALLAVKGIDVNLQDEDGKAPLHLAIEKGNEKIVKALLAVKDISVDLKHNNGKTPLHLAIEKGNENIVKALLKAGADPLLGNRDNKTLDKELTEEAIMLAIISGVGIFVIASVVAAIIVTSAYFIGVSLSVGAMAGIAVAAAVVTGLVAGGIIYEVYKPCNELKEAIAQATSSPGKKLNGVDLQSEISSKSSVTV